MDESTLYNGCLYPLDEDWDGPWWTSRTKKNVGSLLDLCSDKIVQYSSTTNDALDVIPQVLCYSLLKAALRLDKDRSLEVLIAKWPQPTLCLKKFAPKLFDNMEVLYKHFYAERIMARGAKYTTCLAHTFVECLKKRTATKLRCLDLTGYPTAEVIVNYLASHALLVHNEARQKEIISVYNEITQTWPNNDRRQYSVDSTLPEERYVVRLDAKITDADTHMELCRALRASQSSQQCLKLEVNRLELNCLGPARVTVLLGETNRENIKAISLQYNSLRSMGIICLGPELQKLPNLTSLDLSCNGISLQQTRICDMMADTLASLPLLVRLDMHSNWLKNSLRRVLSRVQRPLEYLQLSGCGLKGDDLVYLQKSHHTAALQFLNISYINFASCVQELSGLLRSIASTVKVLEIEDIGLSQADWATIFSECHMLSCVTYWNISRNIHIIRDTLLDAVPQFVKMQHLQVLLFGSPVECWVSQDPEEIAQEQINFYKLFFSQMLNCSTQAGKIPAKLVAHELNGF